MRKQRFPLLDQMRAEARRREDTVTRPFKEELERAAADILTLRRRLTGIERALGNGVAAQIERRMTVELAEKLQVLILTAAAEAASRPLAPVTVTIPPEIAHFTEPSSVANGILRQYLSAALPALQLRADNLATMSESATVIDVRLPALGFRHVVPSPAVA